MATLSDAEVSLLVSRLNFYESTVDQLRDKIPVYLGRQAQVSSGTQTLIKALRNVASSEPDRRLQNALFLFATKHELLDRERGKYRECEKELLQLLDNARRLQIFPLKTILEESPQTQKNRDLKHADPMLAIHSHFFELHRLRTIKKTARRLLTLELRHHARVMEELSTVLSAIDAIDTF